MPSPELQSPFSCTWKPCVAPGLSPVRLARTCTTSPSCVKVTVPFVPLPFVGSRFATADGPCAPPMPSWAQPATSAAAASVARRAFMRVAPCRSFLRALVGRFLLGGGGVRLRFHRGALRRRRGGGHRHRLRHRPAHLLHVGLEVLHRGVLDRGLLGLSLLCCGGVLRLLHLGGGLRLLVGRRRRRDLRPGGRGAQQERAGDGRDAHALSHQSSPMAGCAPAGTIFSGRLPAFTSSYQIEWCSRAHSSST